MLFNGSTSWREGVLVSPLANISSSTGQRLSLEVFVTTNLSSALEILATNELDHVSFPVQRWSSTSTVSAAFAENDWTTVTACLPPGVYRLLFVAFTTPGNYVAIDNVSVVTNDSCQATAPSSCNVTGWIRGEEGEEIGE